jgi:hypothetical protein
MDERKRRFQASRAFADGAVHVGRDGVDLLGAQQPSQCPATAESAFLK